jgi:hypothetical protein
VASTSPSGCQAQGVCKYTKLTNKYAILNKYANAMALEKHVPQEYAN